MLLSPREERAASPDPPPYRVRQEDAGRKCAHAQHWCAFRRGRVSRAGRAGLRTVIQ